MMTEKEIKDRNKQIDSLMSKINESATKKGAKNPLIFKAADRPDLITPEFITTGIMEVDEVFGGGVPKGIVTTFWGPYNCGKTFLAMRIASEITKQGGTVLYVDLEGMGQSLDLFEKKLGLIKEQVYVLRANDYGDEVVDAIEAFLYDSNTRSPRNLIDLVIVDSISNLAPKANTDKSDKDGAAGGTKVGAHAKLMTDWLNRYYGRGVVAGNQAVILISQARANISTTGGGHGPAYNPTGGNAVLHDSRLMVKFGKKPVYRKNKQQELEAVGHIVKLTVEKNSITGYIGKKAEYTVVYEGDLDDIKSLVDKMTEWGYILSSVPKRGYYTIICPGLGDVVVKGKDELEKVIRARVEIYECLKNLTKLGKPRELPTLIGTEYSVDDLDVEEIDEGMPE